MSKTKAKLIEQTRSSLKKLLGFASHGADIQKIVTIDRAYEQGMDALDELDDDKDKWKGGFDGMTIEQQIRKYELIIQLLKDIKFMEDILKGSTMATCTSEIFLSDVRRRLTANKDSLGELYNMEE